MMKTVHMAVYDTFSDWEVGYATATINRPLWHRDPGTWQVRTVGSTREAISSMGGMRVTPDLGLGELDPADSAMLILPGSGIGESGALAAFGREAREFLAAGVPVAALCGGTFMLAVEGLLDDRPHTSNAAEYLALSGYSGTEHYLSQPAVTDGDLITASGTCPVEFTREIFARLGIFEPHILEAWYQLYGHNDAQGFRVLADYESGRKVAR